MALGPQELNLELMRGNEAAAEMIAPAYGLEMGLGVQDFPDLAGNLL
jgi:hypothetical protein